jgi:hypothetical protein
MTTQIMGSESDSSFKSIGSQAVRRISTPKPVSTGIYGSMEVEL